MESDDLQQKLQPRRNLLKGLKRFPKKTVQLATEESFSDCKFGSIPKVP